MNNSLTILNQALNQLHWDQANLQLVTKILTEFLYEEMLMTQCSEDKSGYFSHKLIISPTLHYTFSAKKRIFGNWHIEPFSIKRWENEKIHTSPTVKQLIIDTYRLIGIQGLTLGHLLRELNNTLVADCHLYHQSNRTIDELLHLPNHELEGFMHGHPWFVINKGRLGFSYEDYLYHAPEMRHPLQLSWIAVNKKCADFHAIPELNYFSLIKNELSSADIYYFNTILENKKLSSDHYYFMPIHPWQWKTQLITLFSEDIVNQNIIYLGTSEDHYLPTQSIRTFSNKSSESKFQVKLPLSIFNTAVYRGLPSDRTQLAPMLTAWLKKKYADDSFFQNECRLILLGEIASIDYAHPVYKDLPNIPYQYKELLGVIWRENIDTYLENHESAITMAALIHIDQQKNPFILSLIKQSNLSIKSWLQKFFAATIPPLLHWLYQYGLVFSPHGENTLLILDDNYYPCGLAIKDFIDDVNLSDRNLPEINDLPDALRNVLLKVTDHQLTQFIHTGLFVVLYRYLSDILQTYANYSEVDFWLEVNQTILAYQHSYPELQHRFEQFDLLRPSFKKMCLNRLRLLSVGYADYNDRPKIDTLDLMKNPANIDVINEWKKQCASA